jgi:hypothetical protein
MAEEKEILRNKSIAIKSLEVTFKGNLPDIAASNNVICNYTEEEIINTIKKEECFSTVSQQILLKSCKNLIAFIRISCVTNPNPKIDDLHGGIICLYNTSDKILKYFAEWDLFETLAFKSSGKRKFTNILTGKESQALIIEVDTAMVTLEPWEFALLRIS